MPLLDGIGYTIGSNVTTNLRSIDSNCFPSTFLIRDLPRSHSPTIVFCRGFHPLMIKLHVVMLSITLLLWAEKTREQNTCKSYLNRIMTKRPNICFIFEKLNVQGCQIWHSHVSMSFNSAAAHSTRPHNAKKALYVIISAKIPENYLHKSYCHKQ